MNAEIRNILKRIKKDYANGINHIELFHLCNKNKRLTLHIFELLINYIIFGEK